MKKNLFLGIIIIATIAFSIILFSITVFQKNLEQKLMVGVYSQLSELSINNASSIEAKINDQFEMLDALASYIVDEDLYRESVLSIMNKTVENYGFLRCAITFPDNSVITHDLKTVGNVSNSEYVLKGFQGISTVTGPQEAVVDPTKKVILLTVPIKQNDEIRALLTCTYETQYLNRVFKMTSFDGKGYSYITDINGNIISAPPVDETIYDGKNIFDFLKEQSLNDQVYDEIINHTQNMEEGSTLLKMNGEDNYIHYKPLGINDWYIFSVATDEVLSTQRDNILNDVYQLSVIITITFLFLTFLIIFTIYALQRKSKKELESLAYYDNLTNIPNKNLFELEVRKILDTTSEKYAYIILNVNRFKIVNDIFGFAQGDLLLKYIANVINLEKGRNELCSRFDTDNFHVLATYNDASNLKERFEGIANTIRDYEFDKNIPHTLSVGAGVYLIDDKYGAISSMGDKARMALSKIKGAHSSTINFYNNEIILELINEQEIENNMKSALSNGEMLLYLQAKYSTEGHKLVGAEALVRWENSSKKMIMPDQFIPLFEKNGFIIELDMYMVEITCRALRDWINREIPVLTISVNQSRQCLYHPNYIHKLTEILKKYDLSTSLIEIEITERAFLEDEATLIQIIKELHDLGFKVAMDDFGTGYSSLNMLKNIDVDILKIDKNFFAKSINSERGKKIVASIVSMANDLDIEVIAEGIETEDQLNFLKIIHCDIVQGFYFSRPADTKTFEKILIP